MKLFILGLTAALTLQGFANAQVITPSGVTSSNPNTAPGFPLDAMIDGSGLSDDVLTLANLGSVTHEGVTDGNAWATNSNPPDYFPAPDGAPFIEFELNSPQTLTGFVYWGFLRSNGADGGNEAKTFEIRLFLTSGDPTEFVFTADSPTGLNSREFSFPAVENVSSVQITILDNHFGDSSGIGNSNFNGNRLGLSEIRFVNRPQVIVTTLGDEDEGATALGEPADISLREAVNHAPDDALIVFDSGLDGGTITLTTGRPISITKSLIINASDLTDGLTIDANNASRIMRIQPDVTAALHGLTLTGGFSPDVGGAILNDQATLSLSACTLSGNSASSGGGIFSDGGNGSATLSLSSCTLSSNSADFNNGRGGGIFSNGRNGSATLNLSSCTLSSNSAESAGGGIFSTGGDEGSATLSLSACTLSGNSAASFGGAIFSDGESGSATTDLIACTLSDNSATNRGGAIQSDGVTGGEATLSLLACTLTGNVAQEGGGIYNRGISGGDASLSLTDCTLVNNVASSSGGAVFNDASSEDSPGSATVTFQNSIIAGNVARLSFFGPDLAENTGAVTTATGNNLVSSLSGSNLRTAPPEEITLLGSDPVLLSPLGNYGGPTQTMHPLADSPALLPQFDFVFGTDQRGFTFSGIPTIGAVKRGGVLIVSDEATLRNALEESANTEGQVVLFNAGSTPGLDGVTITLTSGQLEVPSSANGLFIDGSNLAGGLTIDAAEESRVLLVNPGATAALHGLTLTGGRADSGGGGILNDQASLSLSACTLFRNSTPGSGGGILNSGRGGTASLTLNACTLDCQYRSGISSAVVSSILP